MTMQRLRWWFVLIGGAYTAWAAWFISRSSFVTIEGTRRFCLFDDAMISLRYAWNLAHGHGLVFNPGERVEGFTNLLQVLVMTVPAAVLSKPAAVLAMQLLGVLVMLAVAWCCARAAALCRQPRDGDDAGALQLLVFAAILCYYPLSFWTLMGMETGLLSLLLAASLIVMLTPQDRPRARLVLPLLLGLAFWCRPDALLAIAILVIYRWLTAPRSRAWYRSLTIEAAVLALMGVSLTLFRLLYYGHIVPNTYYLKMTGIPLSIRLANGLRYGIDYLVPLVPLLLIAAGGWLVHRRKETGLLVLLGAAAVGYQVWIGGDAWPMTRAVVPVVPFVVIASSLAVLRLLRSWQALPRQLTAGLISVAVVLVAAGGSLTQALGLNPISQIPWNQLSVSTAQLLQRVCREEATVAVVCAGTIPYYTGLRAYDMLGKADAHIAHLPPAIDYHPVDGSYYFIPGHNKHDLRYTILDKLPTYVQVFNTGFSARRENVWEQVAQQYVFVPYPGVGVSGTGVYLLAGSPDVDWEAVERMTGVAAGSLASQAREGAHPPPGSGRFR